MTLVISILLVLSFGIWEIGYLEETSDYVLGDVDYVQGVLENKHKGYKEREDAVNTLKETWKSVKSPWSIYINHAEIDSINQRVISYSVYVLEDNKLEATNEYQNLVDNIMHIVDSQKLLPKNVF